MQEYSSYYKSITSIEPTEMTMHNLTDNVKKTDSLASAYSFSILQAAPGLTRR